MLIFLLKVIFLFGALGLEMVTLLRVINDHLSGSDIFEALLLHIIACSLMSGVLLSMLTSTYQASAKLLTFLLFFMLAFYIPLLGMLGLMLALLPGLRPINTAVELPMNFNRIRTVYNNPVSSESAFDYGAISLESLLQSHKPEKRMEAVYATLKLEDKQAIPLLRIALRDPVDDIRLLAYALIDRKEHRISERIEGARKSLENRDGGNTRHLYRSIVKDYWEIAHLGLVEGETLNFVLKKACEYLELGLQRYPTDRGLHFQYGKFLLKMKNPKLAYEEFKKAEHLGVERKQLLLYYAEIDFLQRRYGEVKRYMNEIEFTRSPPQIYAASRFWRGGLQ